MRARKIAADGSICFDRALWMPLHGDNEVIGDRPFQRFDDAVFRAAGHNTQAVPNRIRGLVMRRVHRDHEVTGPVPWFANICGPAAALRSA